MSTYQKLLDDAQGIRAESGMLTVAETAHRFEIGLDKIARAVDAAEVASVTLRDADGLDLVLLPTKDGAVAEWLEAQ